MEIGQTWSAWKIRPGQNQRLPSAASGHPKGPFLEKLRTVMGTLSCQVGSIHLILSLAQPPQNVTCTRVKIISTSQTSELETAHATCLDHRKDSTNSSDSDQTDRRWNHHKHSETGTTSAREVGDKRATNTWFSSEVTILYFMNNYDWLFWS